LTLDLACLLVQLICAFLVFWRYDTIFFRRKRWRECALSWS